MDVLETDSFEYWGTGSRLHGITVGVSDTELVCTKPFSFMRILIRRKKTGIATITIKKATSRKKMHIL